MDRRPGGGQSRARDCPSETLTFDQNQNVNFLWPIVQETTITCYDFPVLGRDGGVPLIYSDQGESTGGHPEDQGRWQECWNRHDVVQMIRFHNAVQGMPQRSLWEDDGFFVFARGDKGIVAINKTDQWVSPTIRTYGLCWGAYRCQIHQHLMPVAGDWFPFSIPPRQAQLWPCEG